MTITSGFFNSINGDRKYDATWFAQYFASFIGNGVFPNPSTGLQVVEGEGMQTVVRAGKGWINGYFVTNDSDHILQHDVADGVLKRIDRVIMRLNYVTRQIEIEIKKGAFASNPVAPVLKRDAESYELALADVLINNGALEITQTNITDIRLNTELCGIVHGLIGQVDTTTIFNQYQAWFNSVKDGTEQEIADWQQLQYQQFMDWFATIQDILDGDVAANLAGRIANLEGQFATHLDENASLTTKGHTQLQTIVNDDETKSATPKAVRTAIEQQSYKTYKSGKDSNGIFTVVEKRRENGTIVEKSILSGGVSPQYTNRTIYFYGLNGATIEKVIARTLSYDSDGILVSEV